MHKTQQFAVRIWDLRSAAILCGADW